MIKNNKCHSNGTMKSMTIMILLVFVCLVVTPAIAEEIIVETDGDKAVITFPDGTVIRTYVWGGTITNAVSITFPDGAYSSASTHSDGSILSSTSRSNFNCEITTTFTDTDGTVTVFAPGGTISVIAPDGTVTSTSTETAPDGTVIVTDPFGSVTETAPDGTVTVTITDSDGTVTKTITVTGPDGTVTETVTVTGPDGTEETFISETAPYGTITITEADGTVTVIEPGDTDTTQESNQVTSDKCK